jgi:hypothetical protein
MIKNNLIQASKLPVPLTERKKREEQQAVRIAPLAWLKLRMFLHADEVEVGGFGVSSAADLLYIEDFIAPKQFVTAVTVELDDDAVADHFDRCADAGISPARAGRCWIHTHPAMSPQPSMTDEQTFERVFGACDWAAMIIVARGAATYCRLRFNIGPGGEVLLPLDVDWERFPGDLLDHEGKLDDLLSDWMDEYGANVHQRPLYLDLPEVAGPHSKENSAATRPLFDELEELHELGLLEDAYVAWAEALEEGVMP